MTRRVQYPDWLVERARDVYDQAQAKGGIYRKRARRLAVHACYRKGYTVPLQTVRDWLEYRTR